MAQIGIPTLKLKTSKTNTQRGGSFLHVAGEALEERWGRDPDINPQKTKDNIYTGYTSAKELYEYSKEHISELEESLGRKIRNDSVKMVAAILKPSKEYMDSLNREQQIKLLNDGLEKFKELVGPNNVKSTVIHFDEQSPHMHIFYEPMTADGRLSARETLNLPFYHRVNTELPKYLKEKGWDIDAAKMYDAENMTEQEKIEHRAKRKKHNMSSTDYKSKAEMEKLEIIEKQLSEKKEELTRITESPSYEKYEDVLRENNKLKEELTQKNSLIEKLKEEIQKYKELTEDFKNKITTISKNVGARIMRAFGIDVSYDTPEYPSQEFNKEILSIKEKLSHIDFRLCSIVQNSNDGKFRIVYKEASGKYIDIAGGFATRKLAEIFRRNLSESARSIKNSTADDNKNGISR